MFQISNVIGSMFILPSAAAWTLAACLAAPTLGQTEPSAPGGKENVSVDDYGTVDLAVQDTDLAQVLQMLSIHSKKNLITSKSVSATVTANLYGVTFYEALDAILHVNGYDWVEKGNFIYIYTFEEKQAIEEKDRKRESRIFVLDHLNAVDANEFIQPLLSDIGHASARGEVDPGIKPDVTDAGADSYAFSAVLVVNDYTDNLEAIAGLLQELDTPPQEVLVESTVLQVSVDETNAFGIDFTALGSINFADLTNPLSAVANLLQGNTQGADIKGDDSEGFQPGDNRAFAGTSTVGNTSGPGGLKIGVVTDDISVFLRVLDQVSDNTVLARPRIMALNRQRAEVLVGARVGYLSTTATETTTTQTVEFLDTGIQLIFRPFISKDGSIRLELKPSVSEARLRNVTDSNGQLVTIPDELTNEITTNVRVHDGETLVLGGLFKENVRKERRQIPYLGDVPILGAAFRGNDDSVERTEIIFLITPTIVKDRVLWAAGQSALDMIETARVGMRSGLLPWSQEAVTANHNQDAAQALADGDTAKALYHLDASLRQNPNQPEIIKLRDEAAQAAPSRIHERSLMHRILEKELGDATPVSMNSGKPSKPAVDPLSDTAAPGQNTAGNLQPDAHEGSTYATGADTLQTSGPIPDPAAEGQESSGAPSVASDGTSYSTSMDNLQTEGPLEDSLADSTGSDGDSNVAPELVSGPSPDSTADVAMQTNEVTDAPASTQNNVATTSDVATNMDTANNPNHTAWPEFVNDSQGFVASAEPFVIDHPWGRFWFCVATGRPLGSMFTNDSDSTFASVSDDNESH